MTISLLAVTMVALAIVPVYGAVESIQLLPPVLIVGQPIIIFGFVSGSTIGSRLYVQVYEGPNCQGGPIASTYALSRNETETIENSTVAIYNVTLAFPIVASSGWVVAQQYQNGIPAGTYSVGVGEVAAGSALCKNFTITSQSITEFSDIAPTLLLTLLAFLCLVRRRSRSASRRAKDRFSVSGSLDLAHAFFDGVGTSRRRLLESL